MAICGFAGWRGDDGRAHRQGTDPRSRPARRSGRASNIPTSSFIASTCIICCSMPAVAAPRVELVADAMVTGFEDHSDSVAVKTADGRAFSGAALVAADGFRSLFRAQVDRRWRAAADRLCSASAPSCRWRSSRPMSPRDCVALWGGPGLHIVHYPLRHGSRVQHRRGVPHCNPCARRATPRPIVRNSKTPTATCIPPMRALIGDDGSCAGAARSPTAIRFGIGTKAASCSSATPRMRRCNRWRRAPAWRSRMACAWVN